MNSYVVVCLGVIAHIFMGIGLYLISPSALFIYLGLVFHLAVFTITKNMPKEPTASSLDLTSLSEKIAKNLMEMEVEEFFDKDTFEFGDDPFSKN